jgi:hypothetical protein
VANEKTPNREGGTKPRIAISPGISVGFPPVHFRFSFLVACH